MFVVLNFGSRTASLSSFSTHPTPSTSIPHFLHRGLLQAVSLHACWTVPMLCPLPPHLLGCTPARTRVGETTGDGQRVIKGVAVTETVLHSGTLCTVLIMFSFVSPMSLTPAQFWAFQAALPLLLYSFFFGSKKYLRLRLCVCVERGLGRGVGGVDVSLWICIIRCHRRLGRDSLLPTCAKKGEFLTSRRGQRWGGGGGGDGCLLG